MRAVLLSFSLLFVFLSSHAWAACPAGITTGTCYYVRNDGGNNTQCDGKTDHALAGASGTNCAFSHLAWALIPPGGTGTAFAGGDALIIDNIDENVGSGQAQYMIGYGMPNTVGANCAAAYPYGCTMQQIPAGPDAAHTTKIYGKGFGACPSTTSSKGPIMGH